MIVIMLGNSFSLHENDVLFSPQLNNNEVMEQEWKEDTIKNKGGYVVTEVDGRKKHAVNHDDRCDIHVHMFNLESDVADEHQHVIQGISGPAVYRNGCHVHCVNGRTSFLAECDHGHWHAYDIMSGPNEEMPDGTHTHYFNGDTSYNDGHCHSFADVTGLAPDMEEECEQHGKCVPKHKRPDENEKE